MIPHPLDAITDRVLLDLVTQGVSEGRGLEFKAKIASKRDSDVKEFLADVTSFANSAGGDLVYGLAEKAGVATELAGIDETDEDAVILRLENLVRTGIEPRIAGLRMRTVPLVEGKLAIILRIPASAAAPHRVIFQNSARFHARNSKGKYEMDTFELRQAFLANEAVPARLRELHDFAVESASKGRDLPFRVHQVPAAVVSITPFNFLRAREDVAVTRENALAPIKAEGRLEALHMIEGVLLHSALNAGSPSHSNVNSVRSYALTHRRGRIDVAWAIGWFPEEGQQAYADVSPARFEEGVDDAVRNGMARLSDYGLEGPWLVTASLISIKHSQLIIDGWDRSDQSWRDKAKLGELLIDDPAAADLTSLKAAFWLAFGRIRPALCSDQQSRSPHGSSSAET